MSAPSLPSNVHVSTHPCLLAKLSQLRSKNTSPRDVKTLVHEISMILGCEALAQTITASPGPQVSFACHTPAVATSDPACLAILTATLPTIQDQTPLGFEYTTTEVGPETISLVPILRSGLGMVEGDLPPSLPPSSYTSPSPLP